MRHSGSPTPPSSTRSGASSPPPPPPPPSQQQQQQPPRRLGSPAHSTSAGTASERDPFSAQTAGIPLTEQDRQEGYDVELLNARPRGRYSTDLAAAGTGHDTDDDSSSGREKYTAGAVAPVASHHGTGLAPGIGAGAPLAAGAGAGGIALGPIGSGPQYAYGGIDGGAGATPVAYNKEYPGGGGPGGGGGEFSGGNSGTTAVSGRRKPWFSRPLPLLLVIGVIIGIALAVGLGVGLSQHHSGKSNNLAASGGSSGDRNSTSSRTSRSRSIGSTGTVVPSSLYSSYTSEHPQSTTTSSAIVVESAITTANGTITTATFVTSVPVPANGTTSATTGNRPVPAASSTMINGTVLSALTSAFAAETARIRRR